MAYGNKDKLRSTKCNGVAVAGVAIFLLVIFYHFFETIFFFKGGYYTQARSMTSFLLERVEEVETMQGNSTRVRANPSMMKTTSPPDLKSTVYLLLCSALGQLFKLKCQIKSAFRSLSVE